MSIEYEDPEEGKEPHVVCVEKGEEFGTYAFLETMERVPYGAAVGVEAYNPRTKEWEFMLFGDVIEYIFEEEIEALWECDDKEE